MIFTFIKVIFCYFFHFFSICSILYILIGFVCSASADALSHQQKLSSLAFDESAAPFASTAETTAEKPPPPQQAASQSVVVAPTALRRSFGGYLWFNEFIQQWAKGPSGGGNGRPVDHNRTGRSNTLSLKFAILFEPNHIFQNSSKYGLPGNDPNSILIPS